MTRVTRSALVALAGFAVALGTAHTASAAPECTDVGETVTFCDPRRLTPSPRPSTTPRPSQEPSSGDRPVSFLGFGPVSQYI